MTFPGGLDPESVRAVLLPGEYIVSANWRSHGWARLNPWAWKRARLRRQRMLRLLGAINR